jgi:hypothetical protein
MFKQHIFQVGGYSAIDSGVIAGKKFMRDNHAWRVEATPPETLVGGCFCLELSTGVSQYLDLAEVLEALSKSPLPDDYQDRAFTDVQ